MGWESVAYALWISMKSRPLGLEELIASGWYCFAKPRYAALISAWEAVCFTRSNWYNVVVVPVLADNNDDDFIVLSEPSTALSVAVASDSVIMVLNWVLLNLIQDFRGHIPDHFHCLGVIFWNQVRILVWQGWSFLTCPSSVLATDSECVKWRKLMTKSNVNVESLCNGI